MLTEVNPISAGIPVLGIFVHVGQKIRDQALAEESDTNPFEPMIGMVMKDYLLLTEEIIADSIRLNRWLDRSSEYLKALGPKQKKQKIPQRKPAAKRKP